MLEDDPDDLEAEQGSMGLGAEGLVQTFFPRNLLLFSFQQKPKEGKGAC